MPGIGREVDLKKALDLPARTGLQRRLHMSNYLITREGQELGSFELSQIKEGLQTGYFQASDWGWREGMAEWQPLATLANSSPSPAATQPVASAPKARPVAVPVNAPRSKPAGTSAINPYAAPAAKGQGASPVISAGSVPYSIITELSGTKPWVRLISVIMWIACGFMILAVVVNLFIGAIGASALSKSGNGAVGAAGLIVMMVVYGISAMLIIYPTLKLSKYASNISRLVQSQSFVDLTAALAEQRRFWKFYGILTVIYLGVVLVVVLFMVAGVGLGFMARP